MLNINEPIHESNRPIPDGSQILPTATNPERDAPAVVLSFDVESHALIEAASGLALGPELTALCAARVAPATEWLLEALARRQIRATFFLVGQLARTDPGLVRAIVAEGHEVASHGWDHRRILAMDRDAFRRDLAQSKDALEQVAGAAVLGYRAPTFSLVRTTAWAVDVLAEAGLLYDSSIYPVRHDRYGVPTAPRAPFLARGPGGGTILELPPATLRLPGLNLPVGGGGYFRLLPPALMERALAQVRTACRPAVATLYFHPWEFDPEGPRLPLRPLSRLRTYVGVGRSRARLEALLGRHRFERADAVARRLDAHRLDLPTFAVADD